jgi:tryptophan synthase alpha chain
MNRIEKLFSAKNKNILNIYCTAGYPELNSIAEVLLALQEHGADMVEVGIPYSDPLADGPVIQESNMTALKNGMSIQKLFDQLKDLRNLITPLKDGGRNGSFHLPLILMGYLNPVIQYGFEKFCRDAKDVGVDGIILPDLPIYEFETEYKKILRENELDFIFLITPETSEERIKKIDELTTGFIYAVSSSSTTGKDTNLSLRQNYFQKLQQLKLRNPVLVGFGIKDKQTFNFACEFANGAIIGSAFIKALQNSTDINAATETFLNKILK